MSSPLLWATSPGPASNGSLLLISQKVLKNMSYNTQNDKPAAPMASQHPKTPVWALSAPQSVKK
jgi:hypothetical protein